MILLRPHPVVDLVLLVGDAEKFLKEFGLESLKPSLSQQAGFYGIGTFKL